MLQNKKLIQFLISAVMAILFVNFYLKAKEQNIESGYGMVEVLAAARDIPPFKAIEPSQITVKRVPQKFVEPGAFRVKVPGQNVKRVVGKVTPTTIREGAQLVETAIQEPTTKGYGVAPVIPPGKRAFLLRLGNLEVSEIINPGNFVDIMATLNVATKDGKQTKATFTILQNVLVLTVGKVIRKDVEDVTVKGETGEGLYLTLAVTPTQAEKLYLAQSESQGEITVTVRPHGASDIEPVTGITPQGLIEASPKAAAPKPPLPPGRKR
jgi:Flp pilus assembly protein CpaB